MKHRLRTAVAALVLSVMAFSAFAFPKSSAVELTDEQFIWYYLKDAGLTDSGAAGLMGNLFAESGLKSTNLQNSYESKLGYTDSTYTAAVDNGSYSSYSFIHDSAGYGLAQWTYWSRKQGLYNYAQAQNASIGDLEMQLEYLLSELKSSFPSVLSTLKTATSVREASNKVLLEFEQPADQSTAVQNERTDYGFTYYYKYAGTQRPEDSSEESDEESSIAPTQRLGDINGDGSITSSDCIMLQSAITGAVRLSQEQIVAADVSRDGSVSASDYVSLTLFLTSDVPFN